LLGAAALLVLVLGLAILSENQSKFDEKQPDPQDFAETLAKDRKEKELFLKRNPQSPLPKEMREKLDSLRYFPADLRYRVPGMFRQERAAPGMDGKTLTGIEMEQAGFVRFTLAGKDYEMIVYYNEGQRAGNNLFLAFTDETNGKQTFGGGRYLNITNDGNRVWLDFNRCYNPYCAYDPFYKCAKPPRQNHIAAPILAGEQAFPLEAFGK
jgi:uncharacterized protein (DUF1684 family)